MSTAERILQHLKAGPEGWTSGERLSRELGVSRSAVWKHVRALRRDGYGIDSSPRKGYRLTGTPPWLLPSEIREGLRTRSFGRAELVYCRETDSTNTRAKALASGGAPEGTVVIAETQTGGRGRKGRTWFSPAGEGVYLSLILRPPISPVEAPKITLIAGIAAAETLLARYPGLDVHIKWPNDLLVGGKKVAGILTEISSDMDRVGFVVSGVGLNASGRRFPGEIEPIATSLALETGAPPDRAALVRGYLERYEQWYDLFLTGRARRILDRWKALSRTLGSRVAVDGPNGRITGVARGIGRDGSLLVEDGRGSVHAVFSGDVEAP
jgi:BirA family biotin operon repressor/biotin-[acetyl-CoA-carboxylase] ligase